MSSPPSCSSGGSVVQPRTFPPIPTTGLDWFVAAGSGSFGSSARRFEAARDREIRQFLHRLPAHFINEGDAHLFFFLYLWRGQLLPIHRRELKRPAAF